MVIMNDLEWPEWPMLSYYVIYYEKFRKVMQRTEIVAFSFKFNFRTCLCEKKNLSILNRLLQNIIVSIIPSTASTGILSWIVG